METSIQLFAEAAAEYCVGAEGPASDEVTETQVARRLVSTLYRLAIDLPDAFSETAAPEISEEQYKSVYRRFGSLPFNYYSECFNPLRVPSEEPGVSDLADDLADIWRDLKAGAFPSGLAKMKQQHGNGVFTSAPIGGSTRLARSTLCTIGFQTSPKNPRRQLDGRSRKGDRVTFGG